MTVAGGQDLVYLPRKLLRFGRVRSLAGDRHGVPLAQQCCQVLPEGMLGDPGERHPAFAGGFAARQADREFPRDGLRVLLGGLEERAYLVEEQRPRR